jgi:phosphoglycolate phosphatase-like HAD superfamily hydrolase
MRIGLDLDGTIITCKEKHCILMEVVTKAYGLEFCKEQYWKDKRSGLNNTESLMRQGVTCNAAGRVNDNWIANIENIEWANFDSLIKGAFDSMVRLREQGHSLHLISSRNNVTNAFIQLQALGIKSFFSTTNFVTSVSGLIKSDYFNRLNIDCYIGDTEVDYKESQKSNISFYPVITGMRSKDFFTNLGLNEALNITLEQFLRRKHGG